jgi:hypothetical protein
MFVVGKRSGGFSTDPEALFHVIPTPPSTGAGEVSAAESTSR